MTTTRNCCCCEPCSKTIECPDCCRCIPAYLCAVITWDSEDCICPSPKGALAWNANTKTWSGSINCAGTHIAMSVELIKIDDTCYYRVSIPCASYENDFAITKTGATEYDNTCDGPVETISIDLDYCVVNPILDDCTTATLTLSGGVDLVEHEWTDCDTCRKCRCLCNEICVHWLQSGYFICFADFTMTWDSALNQYGPVVFQPECGPNAVDKGKHLDPKTLTIKLEKDAATGWCKLVAYLDGVVIDPQDENGNLTRRNGENQCPLIQIGYFAEGNVADPTEGQTDDTNISISCLLCGVCSPPDVDECCTAAEQLIADVSSGCWDCRITLQKWVIDRETVNERILYCGSCTGSGVGAGEVLYVQLECLPDVDPDITDYRMRLWCGPGQTIGCPNPGPPNPLNGDRLVKTSGSLPDATDSTCDPFYLEFAAITTPIGCEPCNAQDVTVTIFEP